MKLCHGKRDHHNVLKCPPSTETHAGWSLLIWHNFVRVGDNWIKIWHFAHMMWTGWSRLIWHNFIKVAENWIKIRSLAYIGTHNRHVKCGWKIPNRFGKIATSRQGDFLTHTVQHRDVTFGHRVVSPVDWLSLDFLQYTSCLSSQQVQMYNGPRRGMRISCKRRFIRACSVLLTLPVSTQ